MSTVLTHRTGPAELGWLAEVREERWLLSEQHPIGVRHGVIHSGPPMTSPQRHPFCEISMLLAGRGMQFVEREEAEIRGGDLFLAGPGVPHLHQILEYPHRFATAYFLPTVFIGPGPGSDGLNVLRRVTARQPLAHRLIRPSPSLRVTLERCMMRMIDEWEKRSFGCQMRLQSLLFDLFVELLRWEQKKRNTAGLPALPAVDWKPLDAALRYLRDHFREPVYGSHLAQAADISEASLKTLFHDALGMTWVHYLQGYRIHQAATALSTPGHNVTEAAFSCGFESLSHFNATFHRFLGMPPKEYAKSQKDSAPRKQQKNF